MECKDNILTKHILSQFYCFLLGHHDLLFLITLCIYLALLLDDSIVCVVVFLLIEYFYHFLA